MRVWLTCATCALQDLDACAPRMFAILRPLRVRIENYQEAAKMLGQEGSDEIKSESLAMP